MGDFLDNLKNQTRSFFSDKKNVVSVLILGILVLALPIGITLIRQQQIIKSQAAVDPIVFSGDGVTKNNNNWVSTKQQVTIKLTSPLGPPPTPAP